MRKEKNSSQETFDLFSATVKPKTVQQPPSLIPIVIRQLLERTGHFCRTLVQMASAMRYGYFFSNKHSRKVFIDQASRSQSEDTVNLEAVPLTSLVMDRPTGENAIDYDLHHREDQSLHVALRRLSLKYPSSRLRTAKSRMLRRVFKVYSGDKAPPIHETCPLVSNLRCAVSQRHNICSFL